MARRRKAHLAEAAATRGALPRGRDRLLLLVCVVGLLAAWLVYGSFGGAGWGGSPGSGAAAAPAAAAARQVLPAPVPSATARAATVPATNTPASPAPAAAPPVAQGPAASAPQRIIFPAARMDVVVHPLQPDTADIQSQSIVPPETMDGYWLATFGIPGAGSTNTTYVIGHSWEGLDAAFNRLSTMAAPGDELTVETATGAIAYRVDSVTTYTKSTLKDSPIWTAVPNRLVLISCYTQDLWGKNVAVVASPVPVR
jgi:hypothetical protein